MRTMLLIFCLLILTHCLGPGINSAKQSGSPPPPETTQPSSQHLLLLSATGRIHSHKFTNDGTLSKISELDGLTDLGNLAFSNSGNYVYGAPYSNSDKYRLYFLNPETGELSAGDQDIITNNCSEGKQIATTTGNYIYLGCSDLNIRGYALNPDTGLIDVNPKSTTPLSSPVNRVTTSNQGTYLHVRDNGLMITSFKVENNGTLTQKGDSLVVTTLSTEKITATDRYLYWAQAAGTTLEGFSIGQDGSLSSLTNSPFTLFNYTVTELTQDYVISSDSKYLYTLTSAGNLRGYNLNQGGTPTELSGSPFFSGLQITGAIEIDPENHFLFFMDDLDQKIYSYPIEPNTGALTTPKEFSITPEVNPPKLTVH